MFTWVNASRPAEEVADSILQHAAQPFHTGRDPEETSDRLTKEEEKQMKGYLARYTLFDQDDVVDRVLQVVREHLPEGVPPMEGDALKKGRNNPAVAKEAAV